MISKRSLFWLLIILMPVLIGACSNTSSSLGQYHEGRILLLNVLEMDTTDELRYSTIDPEKVVRRWRIQPQEEGNELLLMRIKVENHVAVNAVFVADQQAAIIGDFFENDYRPLSVNDSVYLDGRGRGDAVVTMESGECFDHPRTIVNAGSAVRWTNGGEIESAVQFDTEGNPGFALDSVKLAPGDSVSHVFNRQGIFDYQCSGGDGAVNRAQILVESADSERNDKERSILFLEGPFELKIDTSIDGWMVFEVPKNTKIRDLRWRAGDSITVRF